VIDAFLAKNAVPQITTVLLEALKGFYFRFVVYKN